MTTTSEDLSEDLTEKKQMSVSDQGATVWLTGLPSAGKTTIAYALAERL
ncbi:adenylyl-sulfate kinase, partial [Streptomyces lavendulae]